MAGPTITPIEGPLALARPAAISEPRKLYFSRTGSSRAAERRRSRDRSALEKSIAVAAIALLLIFYVALPSLKLAGFPLRGLLSLAILAFVLLARPNELAMAFRQNLPLIGIAAGLATLGLFVSVVNGASFEIMLQTLREVHFQLVVLILAAAALTAICGPRACMWAIVAVIGGSAFVALLQMLDVDAAWDLRRSLGPLAKDELQLGVTDRRPTGLSYSPIQLSTQLCLAFAAFAAVRYAERIKTLNTRSADPAVIIALMVLVAGSIATATRSPILGAVIFLVTYVLVNRQIWLAIALAAGAVSFYLVWPLVESVILNEAPRVLRTDDKSAAARSVFAYYGVRLFIDNPLGYGFSFHPAELWAPYWPELYMMRGSRGTQENQLHNYVLSMINIYGIGILLFAPVAIKLLLRGKVYALFFIPYAVHILFHNSGPFYSDNIIWFVIAAIGAAAHNSRQNAPDRTPQFDRASLPALAGSAPLQNAQRTGTW